MASVHPSVLSVRVKALQALIDLWGARSHAIGRRDPDDPRVQSYVTAASELREEIANARREHAEMLKRREAAAARDAERERDAAMCVARYARKHRLDAEMYREKAEVLRAEGYHLAARETATAAENAAHSAARAAAAVEIICEHAALDPQDYLKD